MNNNKVNSDIVELVRRRVKILDDVNRTFLLEENDLQKYQIDKMCETLHHVYKNNEFYRNKFINCGLTESMILEMKEFNTLPFTTKEEIKSQYPFGLQSAEDKEIVRYGESTGTTGEPINSYYTNDDWFANNCIVANILSNFITKDDTVGVIVPYGLALVGQDIDRALELIGAKTIAIGLLSSACPVERAIKILKDTGTTALVCSPSRALYLAEEAIRNGYNPKENFKIRKILCVGEGTSKEKAKAIKDVWGADAYPLYGMTETNTLAMSCICGKLHLIENKIFYEIIDLITKEVLGKDVRGELVVTSFVKGMPLIRYRTGDLCTIHSSKCECGSSFKYLEHHGRITDSIQIAGKKIQILDIESVILSNSGSRFYTLKIENDVLTVGLVLSEEACKGIDEELKKQLKMHFGIESYITSINGDEILNEIKTKVKPSISSILINKGN